jgi:central kinetochore subunit Mis15/CHL4
VNVLLSSSAVDKYNAAPPIYLALPQSSPYIIHSHLNENNPYLKGIFQTVTKLLSRSGIPVELQYSKSLPTKSIPSLLVLKGASREANVQGPWKIYSKGKADIQNNPLGPKTVEKAKKRKQEFDFEEELRICKRPLPDHMLKKLTKLRFHGDIEASDDSDSKIQISYNSFMLKVPHKRSEESEPFVPSIKLEMQGSDIFGGMKELALKRVIDIEKMPSWLTGENGVSSGTITADRQFQKD